ncbi:hypothetical protein [Natronobacterium gregoryi]|uniref:Uncharacterized protein n=2 Tax=Natronobacterium gregoryi TaxID=44930 RepID=L0AKG1_NATGS|nr:hypothetical protein [Natronobacterium gregoryi]AFZ74286.1 hypothetical protein Natgr_3155 [Natronobacterium gregoryi SP2]ELY63745.1 hypothetical protein C490_15884 [Natronobacterium gregoryi SP2]PLK22205.1 hypothetical protein CYV19_00590 [Natronobacterium gregoryi SP2]SFI53002.1 hypothetical protein SAMN05443661_101174 [Natronobacterium gregoryi]
MVESADRDDPAEVVEQLDRLATGEGPGDDERRSVERLALDLVRHYHDRINELYYEHDLSDATAEARTLEEAGLSTPGIALAMTATGRDDVSERTVAEYLQ